MLLGYHHMRMEPLNEAHTADAACGNVEHDALLLVYASDNLMTIQDEKGLHRRVACAFVAVDKWVIANK